MPKKRSFIVLVSVFALIFSISLVSAQPEGIPLQKDVFLGAPIYGPEDLPEQITFNLYDSKDAFTPLGSQTFPRGQYTVDFENAQLAQLNPPSEGRKAAFNRGERISERTINMVSLPYIWETPLLKGSSIQQNRRA